MVHHQCFVLSSIQRKEGWVWWASRQKNLGIGSGITCCNKGFPVLVSFRKEVPFPQPSPHLRQPCSFYQMLLIWALAPQPFSYVFNLFPFFPTSRRRMVQWLRVWLLASGCLGVNTPALLASWTVLPEQQNSVCLDFLNCTRGTTVMPT